jgi:hydrogenase maturation protease
MTTAFAVPKPAGLSDTRSILVACVGNIFLGDDGFGVEVARRLATRALPDGVRVEDFGIRGFDLAFALAQTEDATILVDATRRGGSPGTLYLLELDPVSASGDVLETHGMDPANVLRLVATLGGHPARVFLVGCEPLHVEPDVEGLSEPVEAAIEGAMDLVESALVLIREGR